MFRFKQFTIRQDRTAMKVCTDACVLGAYADVQGRRLLDIGTGTGLLALMAAQRNPLALIDAVELDDAAAGQAAENGAESPFAERVRVIQTRIQDVEAAERYDRILTNPPFYTQHLRSPDTRVNRALHTDDLPFGELIDAVGRLLKPDGQWWVLLPPYETSQLIQLAEDLNLRPFQQLALRHDAGKPVFRFVTGFQYDETTLSSETLAIYKPGRVAGKPVYTDSFRSLLHAFYLIF